MTAYISWTSKHTGIADYAKQNSLSAEAFRKNLLCIYTILKGYKYSSG